MSELKGRLRSKQEGASYEGHKVQLEFAEARDLRALSEEAVRSSGGAPESLWISAVRNAAVQNDGCFQLLLPDADHMRGPFTFGVLAPNGQLLYQETLKALPEANLECEVEPLPPHEIDRHPDAFLGQLVKVRGRVLDQAGKSQAAGLQVLIWARREGAGEKDFSVVLASRTDSHGYFSGEYPRDSYAEAYGEVGTDSEDKIPVALENGAFPRRLILVVALPQDEEIEDVATPRAPDPEDLVNSPETYSSDVGGGRCTDFTAPNRTLEEFSYYSIVRTTDPEIKGMTLEDPKPLPGWVLEYLGKLAVSDEALGRVETRAMANPDMAGATMPPADPKSNPTARKRATPSEGVSVSAIRPSPESAPVTGAPSEAVAAGSTVTPVMDIAAALTKLKKEGLTVQPDILETLLADVDGFTPQELMTAARLSARSYLRDALEGLQNKAPGRVTLDADHYLDWDSTPTISQATTIAHGHILHFKQVWHADGYSLGDLLYSLPLAPGQKKQIAILDWERLEIGERREELTEQEQLSATLSRDRDISEIVGSTLIENVEGGSRATTWARGGGFGLAILPLVIGAGGGAGGASSFAWQNSSRSLSANSLQQLRDRTMQAASAIRSQRATVVQSVRQGEGVRAQTEVVANYNHSHAMTVEYFEVLRHFQVSQELVDVQECLFVPLLMSEFDSAKTLRWRESLQRVLLDRSLRNGFDALERIRLHYVGTDLPVSSYGQENLLFVDGEMRIELNIARPRDPMAEEPELDYFQNVWTFWGRLLNTNAADIYNAYIRNQEARDRIFQEQLAPGIARAFVSKLRFSLVDNNGHDASLDLDPTLISDYKPGVPLYVRLNTRGNVPGLTREQVTGVRIINEEVLPADSKSVVHTVYLRYQTEHLNHALVPRTQVMDDLLVGDEVYLPTPLDTTELRNPRQEDQEVSRRLLAHLNDRMEYYHKVIWRSMDPDRRFMLLDGFRVQIPGPGGPTTWRSAASVVENRMIGILGNCMVLPVARGFNLDPTYQQNPQDTATLLDVYAPLTPIPPMRVSVPTRGVFAEAVLGSCNSSEVIDDTRFWRWEESPIPGEPTAIQPLSTETRRAEPSEMRPSPLPAAMINLQTAPAAPDPTALAAALKLLSEPDLFRDITGLTQNQRNALASLQAALTAAQFFGGEAAKLTLQQVSARNIQRAMNEIDKAEKAGGITKDQAQKLRVGALQGMIGGETEKKTEKKTEKEIGAMSIKDLLDIVDKAGSNQAKICVTRPSGEKVEADAKPKSEPSE